MPDIYQSTLERRALWLAEMAWAGGDKALQAGWAEYILAERAKIEAEHPPCRAIGIQRFKELSK